MNKEPKYAKLAEGMDKLSIGISIVVAILLGVWIGIVLKNTFEIPWLLWLGVFWGVAAAILNVYKAYSKQYKEMQKLADEPRYAMKKKLEDDDDVQAVYKSIA